MKRIYGLGNSLIDIEIPITESDLASIGIKKGSMVHINNIQKNTWLRQFENKIASRQPGGSIANSIYAASKVNTSCSFSCSIGKDKEGIKFIEGFNSNNVEVFANRSQKNTGVCFIFITPDGERTMASNLSANEDLLPECLNKSALAKSDWLVFDAFSVCTLNGFKTAKEALKIAQINQLRIAFGLADFNLINSNLPEITWVLNQGIDLLVGNEIEVEALKKTIKIETDTLCTLGSKGAKYNKINVSAKKISVVNTNGAGDALLGIFLSYFDDSDPGASLELAVNYATEVCLVGGPRI